MLQLPNLSGAEGVFCGFGPAHCHYADPTGYGGTAVDIGNVLLIDVQVDL